MFHVTVFFYIALQVFKKNPYFKSVFFKLYLLHSLAKYGVVGTVSEDLSQTLTTRNVFRSVMTRPESFSFRTQEVPYRYRLQRRRMILSW